jgi:cytochrome c553
MRKQITILRAISPNALQYSLVLCLILVNSLCSFGQDSPVDLFDIHCADCHSIGEGDMKGPDLLGVEELYTNDWLLNFIKSSKLMILSGDPKAVAIYEKFDKEKMSDTDLSMAEIQTLIDFIKSFNKNVTTTKAISTDSEDANRKNTPQSSTQLSPEQRMELAEFDERLKDIEIKIDAIFEFQKKSLFTRITTEDIAKGKELFEGTVPFINDAPACVSCHNTSAIDTLNWNPSALDIAETFSSRNNADMAQLVIKPISKKMKEVLDDHTLRDAESYYVTAYLQALIATGLKENKKIPINRIIFLSLCAVLFLALFDLMITQYIKHKLIPIIVILLAGAFISKTLFTAAINIGISQNYAPSQPIKFSHKIHVLENSIECLFCHNTPEFSRESGIPTTNVCMICHNKITTGIRTGRFEINKIIRSYKDNKPIEWIKVHNLPDHVFFSHAQHVSVGKIKCQECHGNIEEMHVTRQYSTLSMGWCVNCHKEKEIQFDNQYYSGHQQLREELRTGKINVVTADKIGANNCQKCHY